MDLPNKVGLGNVLMQKALFREIILKSQYPNLYLLPSGQAAGNTAELLGSEQLDQLLQQLKKLFDLVIIDTPAFLGVADSAILAPRVDGCILVARCNSIKQAPLRSTCQQLASVQANPLGVVVNQVKMRKNRTYQKYYRQSREQQSSFVLRMKEIITKSPQPEENGRPSIVEHELEK
jgi:capsular exopolysaccharide synthesis family protein